MLGFPAGRREERFGVGGSEGQSGFRDPARRSIGRVGDVFTISAATVQRDLTTLTLIEAAIRGGDRNRARHYVAEHRVHKPGSAWGRRLWSRAEAMPRLSAAA